MLKKTFYCVNKDKSCMLFHLLKFMVECGCNTAHRPLKGDIFAETIQFPIKPVPLLSVAVEYFPVIIRAPEENKKEAKWFPGFTLI